VADTPAHLAQVARVFAAMRPFMTGLSHVNYCDLDLQNWQTGLVPTAFPAQRRQNALQSRRNVSLTEKRTRWFVVAGSAYTPEL
jgi:hypothetical protein